MLKKNKIKNKTYNHLNGVILKFQHMIFFWKKKTFSKWLPHISKHRQCNNQNRNSLTQSHYYVTRNNIIYIIFKLIIYFREFLVNKLDMRVYIYAFYYQISKSIHVTLITHTVCLSLVWIIPSNIVCDIFQIYYMSNCHVISSIL